MADRAPGSLPARAWRKLQTRGLRAVPEAAGRRWRNWQAASRQARPVAWAHWGPFSRLLARMLKLAPPPVLILSHPRSGSSWVGATLGNAPNALFLHEPVHQTLAAAGNRQALFYIDPVRPPEAAGAAADRAFAGLPAFSSVTVRFPGQWRLGPRRGRLVIKEINLLACEFFIRRYRPRVVLLLRHPAAVALSYRRLGWWGPRSSWRGQAAHHAEALRFALDRLEAYGDYRVAQYEALCLEPRRIFAELFAFAGLEWGPAVEDLASGQAAGHDAPDSPWELRRDSRRMARSWVGQIAPADLAEIRAGYEPFGLPWYKADEEW